MSSQTYRKDTHEHALNSASTRDDPRPTHE